MFPTAVRISRQFMVRLPSSLCRTFNRYGNCSRNFAVQAPSTSSIESVNPTMKPTTTYVKIEPPFVQDIMEAWITEAFNTPLVKRCVEIPRITKPDQLLLRIKASSMNPIDVRMTEGYGVEILSKFSQLERSNYNPLSLCSTEKTDRLPLIAGRDFSAEVISVGAAVRNYKPGDEVIGVIPVHWQGAHAEYCIAPSYGVARKPLSVSHLEACSMAYVGCTAWNALVTVARVTPENAPNLRVLIHGGSGGIGTTAIQLLKAWGVSKVVATSSDKNCELVEKLGAKAVDYNSPHAKDSIIAEGPYEVVLDCVDSELSRWSDQIMGIWRNCVHVSVVSPLLKDMDRYGAAMGLASTAVKMFIRSYKSTVHGRWHSYAFFVPNSECLEQISMLMDQQKMKPVIESVHKFTQLPDAYTIGGKGHGRGKTVIDFS